VSESTTDIARPKVSSPELVCDDLDSVSIMNALRGVIDPGLSDNIVDLGMVKRLERGAEVPFFFLRVWPRFGRERSKNSAKRCEAASTGIAAISTFSRF
jgi:hypothetical protein